MFTSIPSLDPVLQCLLPAFTEPSFQTHIEVLLGWVMCLGKRTEFGVFQAIQADTPVSRKERHPFDRFYNFFSRSAWTVHDLARQLAMAIVVALNPRDLLYLVVDDTLLHKRGKHVYGLGWFRDAVASTAKRVATASGNHWVVIGLAICIPGTNKIYCLPIHAKLHLAGKNHPSEATLAKEMLQDMLGWFPERKLVFIGDGAYSANNLLADLDPRVTYVGVMRADAAIYDPVVPKQSKGKRGRKATKGPRLPNPKEAVKKADGNRNGKGPWVWQTVKATCYGVTRKLQVLSFQAVWPEVRGLAADSRGVGPRPAGQVRRQVSVHHGCECQVELGDFHVLAKMVDRGRLQSEQTGDEDSSPATLVPAEHREAVAVGVVDAERDRPVVYYRGPQTSTSAGGASAFRRVGHGMVACSYAPRPPRGDPREYN